MPWQTKPAPKKKVEEIDIPDFTQDFLEQIKQITPEAQVASGWPVYRRGGSARHWDTTGANNYVPKGFTQVGSANWSGVAATSGSLMVPFPRRYSGRPLVWSNAIVTTPADVRVSVVAAVDEDSTTLYWYAASGITAVKMAWLAMGPGAVGK